MKQMQIHQITMVSDSREQSNCNKNILNWHTAEGETVLLESMVWIFMQVSYVCVEMVLESIVWACMFVKKL